MPAARVLWSRGICDPGEASLFLYPTLDQLHDPFRLLGMERAVARLERAIALKERILLYGDYDVDGTTSVVILKKALDLAGAVTEYKVPHRLREGYGMRTGVIEEAAARGVRVVVSVDTGIRAEEVARRAGELGVDLIITDHHLPDAVIPPAMSVVNPNQPGCEYPEKNLCGAGVTFKLIQGLLRRLNWPDARQRRLLESFLKMVAVATVADVVPLTGENRAIVKMGLAGLSTVANPGLRALMQVAGFVAGQAPSAGQVAFRIAPRINAAGRMDDASDVVEMFLTDDEVRARALAEQLHMLNQERQETEAGIVQAILAQCDEIPVNDGQFALVFSRPGWHRGVIGIVASRIVERFHRPVFVLGEEDGRAQGSGRSIRAFHLLDALESMPELFEKFGGHRQAAGVTMDASHVEEFRNRLNAFAASRLTAEDLRPTIEIDAVIDLRDLTERAVNEVFDLAPFGFGNPSPLFAVMNAQVAAAPQIIKEKHMRIRVEQNRKWLSAIGWRQADRAAEIAAGSRIDVAVAIEEDAYSASQGFAGWGAVLKDFRASE